MAAKALDMLLLSVQTGQPRTMGSEGVVDPMDRSWTSAIWKERVQGTVWAGREGLAGDTQVSREVHGGPERAVLLYAASHYGRWRDEWDLVRLDPGAFGENLTVQGLDEARVCVGDVYQIGEVRLEVSGPREPCLKLARRHRRSDLVAAIRANHRSGWYARVVVEGWLEAGMPITLLDRPYPQWPIGRAAEVKRSRREDPEAARLLASCPALRADWRAFLGGDLP